MASHCIQTPRDLSPTKQAQSKPSGKKSGRRVNMASSKPENPVIEKVAMKHRKDSVKQKPKMDFLKVGGFTKSSKGRMQQSSSPIPGHSNDDLEDSPPISPLKASTSSLASVDGLSCRGSNHVNGRPLTDSLVSGSPPGRNVIGRPLTDSLLSGSPPVHRSRTASLTDSLTTTDMSDIGASFDDLATTTCDSSPTLSRRTSGTRGDWSPVSMTSSNSQSSFNYSVDSIKRRYKTELWSAIKSDYRYLMDDEIIETCKSTETDLSMDSDDCTTTETYTDCEGLTFKQFMELYMKLSAWLHQTLERTPKKGLTRSEHHLNQILHKELLAKAPSRQSFNSSAHMLMSQHPQLRGEIRRQLAEVNKLWEELESLVKSASGDIDSHAVLKDIETDLISESQWVIETEGKLKPLKIQLNWTTEDLRKQLNEHKEVQAGIKLNVHIITAIVTLCQRLTTDLTASTGTDPATDCQTPTAMETPRNMELDNSWMKSTGNEVVLNTDDVIRAERQAVALQDRCYAVWILSEEWLIRLEDCIRNGINHRKLSDRFIDSSEEDQWDGQEFCGGRSEADAKDIFTVDDIRSHKPNQGVKFYRPPSSQNSGESDTSPAGCDTSDADTAGSLEDSPDFVGARRFQKAEAIAIGKRGDRDPDADSALGRSFSDPSISDSMINGRKIPFNGLSAKYKAGKVLEPVIGSSDLLSGCEEMENGANGVDDETQEELLQNSAGVMSRSVDALDDNSEPISGRLRRIETVDLKEAFILGMVEDEADLQGEINKQEGSHDIGYSSESHSNEENDPNSHSSVGEMNCNAGEINSDTCHIEYSPHCVIDGRITEEEEPLNESCDVLSEGLDGIPEENHNEINSAASNKMKSTLGVDGGYPTKSSGQNSATSAYSSERSGSMQKIESDNKSEGSDVQKRGSRHKFENDRRLKRQDRVSVTSASESIVRTEDELSESMDLPLDDVPVVVYAPDTLGDGITVAMSRSLDSIAKAADERFLSRVTRKGTNSTARQNNSSTSRNSSAISRNINGVNENVASENIRRISENICASNGDSILANASSTVNEAEASGGEKYQNTDNSLSNGISFVDVAVDATHGSSDSLHSGLNGKPWRRRRGKGFQYRMGLSSCDASSEATSSGSEWNDFNTDDDLLTSDDQMIYRAYRKAFKSGGASSRKLAVKMLAKKRTRQESFQQDSSMLSSSDTECEDAICGPINQSDDVAAKLRRVTPPPASPTSSKKGLRQIKTIGSESGQMDEHASDLKDEFMDQCVPEMSRGTDEKAAELVHEESLTPTESTENLFSDISSIGYDLSCADDVINRRELILTDESDAYSKPATSKLKIGDVNPKDRLKRGSRSSSGHSTPRSGASDEERKEVWNEDIGKSLMELYKRTSESLFTMHVDHVDGTMLHEPAAYKELLSICECSLKQLDRAGKVLQCRRNSNSRSHRKSLDQIQELKKKWTGLIENVEMNREETEEMWRLFERLFSVEKRLQQITADLTVDIDQFTCEQQIQQTIDMMLKIQKSLEESFQELGDLELQRSEFMTHFPDVSLAALTENIGNVHHAATILLMQCKEDIARLQLALFSWHTLISMEQELLPLVEQEKQQLDCLTTAHNVVRFTSTDCLQTCAELKTMQNGLSIYEEKIVTMRKLLQEMSSVCNPDTQAELSSRVDLIQSRLKTISNQCTMLLDQLSSSPSISQPITNEPVVLSHAYQSCKTELITSVGQSLQPGPIYQSCENLIGQAYDTLQPIKERINAESLINAEPLISTESLLSPSPQSADQVAMAPVAKGGRRFTILQRLVKYALPLPLAAALFLTGLYMLDPDGSLYNSICGYGITVYPDLQYVRGPPPT